MGTFWKVFLGVLLALAIAGTCAIGGCVFLFGSAATGIVKHQEEERAYARYLAVTVQSWNRNGDYAWVRGSVTNRGSKTVRYWKVSAIFLDAKGTVLDKDLANSIDTLRPGESKAFEIMHRWDRRFTNVLAAVDEVRIE